MKKTLVNKDRVTRYKTSLKRRPKRYKCGECKRILARAGKHLCNGVFQSSDKWETVAIQVKIRMIKKPKNHIKLSRPEKDLLQYICEQFTSAEIGKILGKSKRTIDTNRASLITKLGVKGTVGLVVYAIVKKVVEINTRH